MSLGLGQRCLRSPRAWIADGSPSNLMYVVSNAMRAAVVLRRWIRLCLLKIQVSSMQIFHSVSEHWVFLRICLTHIGLVLNPL